jgi:hypothetical protein
VRWSTSRPSTIAFYFSGPFNGRDEKFARRREGRDRRTAMTLELAAAKFEGTLTGEDVALERKITREHEGAWTVHRDGERGLSRRRVACEVSL